MDFERNQCYKRKNDDARVEVLTPQTPAIMPAITQCKILIIQRTVQLMCCMFHHPGQYHHKRIPQFGCLPQQYHHIRQHLLYINHSIFVFLYTLHLLNVESLKFQK